MTTTLTNTGIGLAIFIIELIRRVLGVILEQEESVMINSDGAE